MMIDRHAERGGGDDCGLPRDQLEIAGKKKARADQHAEDDGDEQQTQGRARPRLSGCAASGGALGTCRRQHQRVLVPFGDGPRLAEPAAPHHGDAIAQAKQLGKIAADQEHGLAAPARQAARPPRGDRRSRRSAPCCRRRCRASARRATAHRRRDAADARSRPSAGCRPITRPTACDGDAHLMARSRIHRDAAARCRAGRTSDAGPIAVEPRQRQVVGDVQTRARPLPPCGPRSPSRRPGATAREARQRRSNAPTRTRPERTRIESEDRTQQLRASGADQTGDAENLAAMQGESRSRRARSRSTSKQRLTDLSRRARKQIRHVAAHHQPHDVGGRHRRRSAAGDAPSRKTTRRSHTSRTSSMKCEM